LNQFKKSLLLAPDRRYHCKCCKCLHFLALQHGSQNR